MTDLLDVGVPSDLSEAETKALALYLRHFNYNEVSRQMGLTVTNGRKMVLRAVDLRSMELLKEADALILAQVTTLLRDLHLLEPLIDREDGRPPDLDAIDYQLKIWDRLSRLLGLDRPIKVLQYQAKLTKEELVELRDRRWKAFQGDASGIDQLIIALEEVTEPELPLEVDPMEGPALPRPTLALPAPSPAPEPDWGEGHDDAEDRPVEQARYKEAYDPEAVTKSPKPSMSGGVR